MVIGLSRYGARAEAAVAGLEQALADADEDVRFMAVSYLGEFFGESGVARAAFCRALKSKDRDLRRLILNHLPESGSVREELVAALRDALSDDDVGYLAADALKRLDPEAAQTRTFSQLISP